MPMHFGRVETELDFRPAAADAAAGDRKAPPAGTDAEVKERLRPVVLQILQEELERLCRQQG
jgi:hypothetical protein